MKHKLFGLFAVLILLPVLCLSLTGCGTTSEQEEVVDTPRIVIPETRQKIITEHYRAILDGSAPFYSVDAAAEITVDQLNLTLRGSTEADVKISAFSITDLNGDGENEVLLWLIVDNNHSYGYTILHHIDDTVYGYTVPYRSLVDLRRDGTFSFYFGDDRRGCANLSFSEARYQLEKISYCDGSNAYFVDGDKSTEEKFSLAVTQQSKKVRAAWYHFTENNIAKHFPD